MPSNNSPNLHTAPARAGGMSRMFVLSWGIGMMTGIVVSAIAVIGALALGYVSIGGTAAAAQLPSPTAVGTPTAASTLLAAEFEQGTPTATLAATQAPPTGLPNFAATATQACSQFHSNFPGTPCPRFSTPSP
jgi:hypothetical protein